MNEGQHIVAEIDGEFQVLFEPAALPWHYISIAAFRSRERAYRYAADEAGRDVAELDLEGLKAIEYQDAEAKADDEAEAGPMEGPGAIVERPVQTAEVEPVSRPSGGGAPPAPIPQPEPDAPLAPANEGGDDEVDETPLPPVDDRAPAVPKTIATPAPAPDVLKGRAAELYEFLKANAVPGGRVPLSRTGMAARSGIPIGTIAPTLDTLERRGFISRADGFVYVGEAPKPITGIAFDSKAPKPAWSGAEPKREAPIVVAPEVPGRPDRLAVVGSYLICDTHHIKLAGPMVAILDVLVANWSKSVGLLRLQDALGSSAKLTRREALRHTSATYRKTINEDIRKAGLTIEETGGEWRLRRLRQAGRAA